MQFSLRWLIGLVTVCAVVAGIARLIPAAVPQLILFAWATFAGGKAIRDAYRKCGPDSQLFRTAMIMLGMVTVAFALVICGVILSTAFRGQ